MAILSVRLSVKMWHAKKRNGLAQGEVSMSSKRRTGFRGNDQQSLHHSKCVARCLGPFSQNNQLLWPLCLLESVIQILPAWARQLPLKWLFLPYIWSYDYASTFQLANQHCWVLIFFILNQAYTQPSGKCQHYGAQNIFSPKSSNMPFIFCDEEEIHPACHHFHIYRLPC